MSRAALKLMHISSSEQEENEMDKQYKEKMVEENYGRNKNMKKYENYKINAYRIRKNILHSPQDQEYKTEHKRENIDFIQQPQLHLQEQNIQEIKSRSVQQQASDTNERQLIEGLNLMNLTQIQNAQESQRKFEKKQFGKSMKNASLWFCIHNQQEIQESTPHLSNVRVQTTQNDIEQDRGKQQIIKQNPQSQFKEMVFEPTQSKLQFINRRIKDYQRLSVVLQRQKSGMSFFLPQMNMIFRNDLRYILSCKKQMGANFEYAISLNGSDFSEKSPAFCGKVVGNFTNSIFNFIDCTNKSVLCTTKFKEQNSKVVAPRIYEVYILNEGENYSELVGTYGDCEKGLDELYTITVNKKKISYFRNKKSQYNKITKKHMLNFNGRAVKGSVKNFIIEDLKSGREVLMFGRWKDQTFNLDISAPLTPLLGLGIVLPHFASKILQK